MKKSKKKTARFYFTFWGMKLLIFGLKLTGKRATHVPGNLAKKMCPGFLSMMDEPEHIIGVTGTNGKTTTANLIADVLQDQGYDILANRFGGNIDSGIISEFIKNSTITGRMKKKYAVLEIDERMTTKILPYVQPEIMVVTNLFRDSYRRNAHPDFIAGILDQTIPKSSKLVLNGEDLFSNQLALSNERVHFGIEDTTAFKCGEKNIINDMVDCPKCGTRLDYKYIRYNHIGRAHCPKCGFASPDIQYAAEKIDLENHNIQVRTPKGTYDMKLIGNNITDVYNSVTCMAALMEYGVAPEKICQSFRKMKIAETRFKSKTSHGKTVTIIAAKGQNPIGCSRVFDYVRNQPGKKAVILMIDDFYDRQETVENIAWFYDTDHEFLNDPDILQVVASGLRCQDNHLRLLMAGLPEEKIVCEDDELKTDQLIDFDKVDDVYILHDIYTTHLATAVQDKLYERLEKEGK